MDAENQKVTDISIEIDRLFYQKTGLNPFTNIEQILYDNQIECTQVILNQLDDFMVIFDEGIKAIIKSNEVCKLIHSKTMKGLSLVVLSAKVVTLLLGIRKMVYSRLVDCAKSLHRPLIEATDIFFTCLSNYDISTSFAKKHEIYDNNKYWKENFAYGKVQKEVVQLFKRLEVSEEYITYFTEKRKEQNNFLSNSIHASFNSAFTNYLMCTLDGKCSDNIFGKVTATYPGMLLNLLEDINLINQVFYLVLERGICSEFEGFGLDNVDPLYLHFYNKYDYLYRMNHMKLYDISKQYLFTFEEIPD